MQILNSFVAIDFEIANPSYASACQVSLVRYQNGAVSDVFESMIRPNDGLMHVGTYQKRKHGFSELDFEHAPTFAELHKVLAEFIGNDYLVAHNVSFDRGVYNQTLASWGLAQTDFNWLCSKNFASNLLGKEFASLENLCRHSGIELINHHDAKADAIACGQAFIWLMEESKASSLSDLVKLCTPAPIRNPRNSYDEVLRELNWLQFKSYVESISEFREALLTNPASMIIGDKPLQDLTVAVTNTVFGLGKNHIYLWIEALGGIPHTGQVTKKVDLLVVGHRAEEYEAKGMLRSANELKAEKFGIASITEKEFGELVLSTLSAL